MSILSNSIYGTSKNKGVGGLLSGLDTDELVNQMAAGTRNKINRAYQSKQKLLYRQEAYRGISSKLLAFSNKYLSFSSNSKNNILSADFFKSSSVKSSSEYVNVSGNIENIKNFTINSVSSVATSASFTSNKIVSNQFFDSSELTEYTSSIAGETMSIEYDGKTYNLAIDSDFGKGIKTADGAERKVQFGDVVKQLNKQLAKIKGNEKNEILKYELEGSAEGEYRIVIKTSDENKTAKLSAAGNALLEVLDMKVGEEASSQNGLNRASLTKTAADILSDEDAYITFDYNGVQKKINLHSGITDQEQLQTHLQNELNKLYGSGKIKVDLETIKDEHGEVIGYGELSFKTIDKEGQTVQTDILGISGISKELGNYMGIESGTYNRFSNSKPISEAGISSLEKADVYKIEINDVEMSFDNSMSVNEIINKINNNAEAGIKIFYSSTTDTFTVRSAETGADKKVVIKDVSGSGNLATALFGSGYTIKDGTDTVMSYTLNGEETTVTRSTADFTIDDMNISLNEKAKDNINSGNPATFLVNNNTDEIVEKVKEFINEYNEIINLISSKTSEKPKRDYSPLTPEQMDEMETKEIEEWTAEAKKGILFGDSKMQNALYGIRGAMSSKTSVSSLILSEIGISAGTMDRSGKLNFDEEKFKEKLAQNPDEVAALFSGKGSSDGDVDGIAYQLQSILRTNIGLSGTSGLLIEEAGLDNGLTSDKNSISEKVVEYDKTLKELKKDLEAEKERYWKKFTALEQALNNLNAQSSWLTDMMGGN
jgi:flagellar hook-associated protein 2